eukprot:GHVL01008507.1.p1 GENE.GHVL01008507.1~~GHVL01008507.1.p1  ORF type:complete len:411 (-),score=58.21 GHVL01008507.1:98-1330(-)
MQLIILLWLIVVIEARPIFSELLEKANKTLQRKYKQCLNRVDVGLTKVAGCVRHPDYPKNDLIMKIYFTSFDNITPDVLCKRESKVLEELDRLHKHENDPMLEHFLHCASQYCSFSCDGSPHYIVVPRVKGEPLPNAYKQAKRLSGEKIDFIIYQLLKIVEFMSKKKIRHNDLQPSNIIWDPITNWLTIVDQKSLTMIGNQNIGQRCLNTAHTSTAPEVAKSCAQLHKYGKNLNLESARLTKEIELSMADDKNPDMFSVGFIGLIFMCPQRKWFDDRWTLAMDGLLLQAADAFTSNKFKRACYLNSGVKLTRQDEKRILLINSLTQMNHKHRPKLSTVMANELFEKAKKTYATLKKPDWTDKRHRRIEELLDKRPDMEYPVFPTISKGEDGASAATIISSIVAIVIIAVY